jgi:hypothetical protein
MHRLHIVLLLQYTHRLYNGCSAVYVEVHDCVTRLVMRSRLVKDFLSGIEVAFQNGLRLTVDFSREVDQLSTVECFKKKIATVATS